MNNKKMKLLIAWIFLIFFVVYGLLPVSITFRTFDLSEPNTLEIRIHYCTCGAIAVINKGQLEFSEQIKLRFPDLQESAKEIKFTGVPLFENIDLIISNTFWITGQVVGAETASCTMSNCEFIPIFQVSDWRTVSYYPRFWVFNVTMFIAYFPLFFYCLQ